MKTRNGMLIFVFLTGMILGVMEPALLHGSETGGGNVWDQFVYTKPFSGTTLEGPLSIYYALQVDTNGNLVLCPADPSSYMATMYYIVKLNKHLETTLYLFQGSSQASYPDGICLADILGQGAQILNFFGDIVSGTIVATPPLFPNGVTAWHLTSIDNVLFHDQDNPPSRAFVADIVITVKAKK